MVEKSQVSQFITECQQTYQQTGFGYWAICKSSDDSIVGLCGLNQHLIDDQLCLHLNYRLGSAYLGQGYATEMVRGMKDYCVNTLNECELYAIIAPTNISSIGVIEGCQFGFCRTTTFKAMDVNIYRAQLDLSSAQAANNRW